MAAAEGQEMNGATHLVGEDTSTQEMKKPGKDHPTEAEMKVTNITGILEGGHIEMIEEGQSWEIIRGGILHKHVVLESFKCQYKFQGETYKIFPDFSFVLR